MDNPPLHYSNKVYTLKPAFITRLQEYFYKLKLKRYKKNKIKESKTPHKRLYNVKFRLKLTDEVNTEVLEHEYEMIVSAHAAFFAKRMVNNDIKRKIEADFIDCEELTDEEYSDYLETKEEHVNSLSKPGN